MPAAVLSALLAPVARINDYSVDRIPNNCRGFRGRLLILACKVLSFQLVPVAGRKTNEIIRVTVIFFIMRLTGAAVCGLSGPEHGCLLLVHQMKCALGCRS